MRTTFPYAYIAKKYNRDYGLVLKEAASLTPTSMVPAKSYWLDLLDVVIQHNNIKTGKSDYTKGYEV